MAATAVDLDLELLQGTIRDRLRCALRYAILAPSTHNTQPWIFRLDQDSVDVYADRSRGLAHIDPDHRELTMSVGAALEHLRVTLASHHMTPEIELLPDSERRDVMARVSCIDEASFEPFDGLLFTQIRQRHTVRGPMRDAAIPRHDLSEMESVVNGKSSGVLFVQEGTLRERLGQMVRLGDEVLAGEPEYRREFARWVRSTAKATDGLPASALGLSGIAGLMPWSIDHFEPAKALADRDVERVREASALAIVCSKGDEVADWLAAGMAVARLSLFAASKGIRCSFFMQPIHVSGCRRELKEATGAYGSPQIVLRLGYADEGEPTPRRPLDDVLVECRQSRGTVCKDAPRSISEPKGGPTQ